MEVDRSSHSQIMQGPWTAKGDLEAEVPTPPSFEASQNSDMDLLTYLSG